MTAEPPCAPVGGAADIGDRLDGAEGLTVALDFDGTLAPIDEDPDAPRITRPARRALSDLVDRPDAAVAVVSGRALSDLRPRVAVDGVRYVGNHGLEYTADDGREVHPGAAERREDLERARDEVQTRLAHVPGVAVEDKDLTATVHYRRTPADRVGTVEDVVANVVSEFDGLEVTSGRQILEIRPGVDWDKGSAVEWLAEGAPDGWATVYVGDDTTDEDAFEALGPDDAGVVVGEHETAASHRLLDRRDVPRLLEWLADDVLGERDSDSDSDSDSD